MLPVLFSISLTTAKASEMIEDSSQFFHLDPEDTTQLKLFIHLSDVQADRAFYALPADLSQTVIKKLNYRKSRLEDAVVDRIVGPGRAVGSIGPPGTAFFCDTNRCFHYGGRPGRLVRHVLVFQYSLPTSTWFPTHPGDGERRNLLPLLKPGDDPVRNALIGASLC